MAARRLGTSSSADLCIEWQRHATHLVPRVAALDASDLCRLVQMAAQAPAVGFRLPAASSDCECRPPKCFPRACFPDRGMIRRPAFSNPRFLSFSTAMCGFFWNALKMSSWHTWQASEPTYVTGAFAGAGVWAARGLRQRRGEENHGRRYSPALEGNPPLTGGAQEEVGARWRVAAAKPAKSNLWLAWLPAEPIRALHRSGY